MADIRILRIKKLLYSVLHSTCWRALLNGVAPAIEHFPVLRNLEVDGVIDVGANRGQFSLACRVARPELPIVAFEPIPAEAIVFKKIHGSTKHTQLVEVALGESRGSALLHLSKSADSSSLLPIGKMQIEMFKESAEVGTLNVPVRALDEYLERWKGRTRQLLKLDVQGYELNVLRGATDTLCECSYVYAECSEIMLYDGQALREEIEKFLENYGFYLFCRCNEQVFQGRLIQADYLFSRK